jgi:hypothetical protein
MDFMFWFRIYAWVLEIHLSHKKGKKKIKKDYTPFVFYDAQCTCKNDKKAL